MAGNLENIMAALLTRAAPRARGTLGTHTANVRGRGRNGRFKAFSRTYKMRSKAAGARQRIV